MSAWNVKVFHCAVVTGAVASSELGAKLPSQQLWQPIHVFLMVLKLHSFIFPERQREQSN